MVQSPVGFVLIAVVIPFLVAVAVISAESLTAPNLAEHHRRERRPDGRWQVVVTWVIAVVVAIVFILALLDLWLHRSPF